jgi:hypothetical protein
MRQADDKATEVDSEQSGTDVSVLGSRDEGGRDGHCGWWWRLLGVDVAVSGQRPSSKQQAEAWVSPIGTRDTGLERAKSSCRRYRCAIQSKTNVGEGDEVRLGQNGQEQVAARR